ncbi:ABC transporter permease subunit [Bacillus sp. 165]|uniref:ABC transporter permease subunit n=1 Tax=Bacillus sp. 165 TaxID=1529117 RepID=UPI001ADA81FB|nr:ABC transporter permease subunit [Bacillus sp. 165]MBO9129397.1 ABC transporter permease subunit [Bacillus sp. 165]
MNIFLREMKAHRKAIIIWCIGVIFLIASGMGKYVGLSSSGQSMNDIMAQMPKSLQAIMGVGSLDISKASGYYGILFVYLVLMATIHAAMLGATIISKEERDKTAEFLFVKPVSRNQVIISKLLAAFANILIFNIVSLVSSIIIVGKYSNGESVGGDIIITIVGMLMLQLIFLAVGTAIAAAYKKPKKAASLSTGVLLIAYILSVAIDLNDKLEFLKYITPFKYYEAKNMMYGGGFETVFVLLSILIIVILFGLTFVFYKKRDLYV